MGNQGPHNSNKSRVMVQFRVSSKHSPAHESGELVASKFQAGPPVSDSGCRRPERPPLLPRSPRPQPLVEDEDAGSAGWRRRQSTSCSPRLGLCAALLGQHAVMLAASARRLSAAASSSSSSMRASLLAAALNPQVRARRVGRGWISSDDRHVLYWWRW